MYKVRMSDGTEFGPGDLDAIVQWCREGRIPRDALLYPADGGEPKSVFAEPRLAALLNAPPTVPSAVAPAEPKPSSWLIPTGNQPALWGYYISVAGFLMLILCPISFVLGAVGIVRAIMKPQAKGLFHGITAMVFSVGSPVLWYMIWQWMDVM